MSIEGTTKQVTHVCMDHLSKMWNGGEEVHGLSYFLTADQCELCTGEPLPRFEFAQTVWAPEDVLTLEPDWSEAQARTWLEENEKYIRDRLTELGWEVLQALL